MTNGVKEGRAWSTAVVGAVPSRVSQSSDAQLAQSEGCRALLDEFD